MNVELRQLRCLVAIADAGSFTDAAIDLGISQAATSRTLASLESALGVRLLRRTTREVALTAAGHRVLAPARRALAAADDVTREAAAGHTRLRIGYAWSAMGRHTTAFQRRWAAEQPDTELQLIRTNSVTAGLAEGACDLAVIRTEPDQRRFGDAIVGLERRYCAMAADDPWAARRSLRLAELSGRVLVIDRRTGTTSPDLWPPGERPAMGRHTTAFQRRWASEQPDTELQLIRTNSVTAGLAEGACDLAVIRTEPDQRRFGDAIVGLERRYCAMAADDPWAARRSLRLAELSGRVVVINRRTGTTGPDLWPPGQCPAIEYIGDVDDWLTAITTGRYIGVTPESTVTQYPRPGVIYRPLRDAPPVPVRLVWWRDDAHPATTAAVGLLTALYRGS